MDFAGSKFGILQGWRLDVIFANEWLGGMSAVKSDVSYLGADAEAGQLIRWQEGHW